MDRAVERGGARDPDRRAHHGPRRLRRGRITATFVLYSALLAWARAEYRIPHRTRDGYGLSPDAMDEAGAAAARWS